MIFQCFLWLTYLCNLKCKHCYAKNIKNNVSMDLDRVKSLADELLKLWVIKIVLSHGEPLIYPHIYDVIALFKEKWFHVTLMSNWLLLDTKNIEKLEKARLDKIFISLDSCDPAIYESLRGLKWSFNLVLKAIDVLKGSKIKRWIASTISQLNKGELGRIMDFAANHWAKELSMLTIRGNWYYDWLLPYEEYRNIIVNLRKYYKERHFWKIELLLHDRHIPGFLEPHVHEEEKENIRSQNQCSLWKNRISISPDGNVYPCNFILEKMWNINESPLEEIIKNNKDKQFTKCVTCVLDR